MSPEIGSWAVVYADLGEDFVDELAKVRNQLHLEILSEMIRNSGAEDLVEWGRTMDHEVQVIQEVIKKARLILRMEGRDKTSQMLQLRRELGRPTPNEDEIWGSV